MGEFLDDFDREHEDPPPKERRQQLRGLLEREYLADYDEIVVVQYVRIDRGTYRVLFWRKRGGSPGWTQRLFCTATWDSEDETWSVDDVDVAGRRHWH